MNIRDDTLHHLQKNNDCNIHFGLTHCTFTLDCPSTNAKLVYHCLCEFLRLNGRFYVSNIIFQYGIKGLHVIRMHGSCGFGSLAH
jgi:hypothetical protein